MFERVCWMCQCVCEQFDIMRSLAIRQPAYTDSNSQAPLSNCTTWLKRGGRTTSHFGDGVSFHGAHTHTHTHTAVFHRGRSGYFGGKVIGAGVQSFPSRIQSPNLTRSLGSDRHRECKRREKGGVLTRTSEMRSGPPCALRHWQRLQPASRWRLGSYSFSADRLPTFIVYSPQDPSIPDLALRYVFFDIVSN